MKIYLVFGDTMCYTFNMAEQNMTLRRRHGDKRITHTKSNSSFGKGRPSRLKVCEWSLNRGRSGRTDQLACTHLIRVTRSGERRRDKSGCSGTKSRPVRGEKEE